MYVNKGSEGQIESFRGPHLGRGPYVVHAWPRPKVDTCPNIFVNVSPLFDITLNLTPQIAL